MSSLLPPTHKEEWRNKHRVRSVIEDRLIELRDIAESFQLQLRYLSAKVKEIRLDNSIWLKVLIVILLSVILTV